jgi:hypothetical protein
VSARTRNRGVVGLTAFAAALALAVAIAGFKEWVPREFTYFGLALFLCCLVVIALIGWRTRTDMLALRDEAARGQMIVMLAARLRDEDAGMLEQMSRRGGPAGEAAALILRGRAERPRRDSGPAA